MVTINNDVIKNLDHSNPTAEGIFLYLSYRQRNRSSTDLTNLKRELLKKGVKVVDGDYLNTFNTLKDAGVGTIKIGRNGNPSKFFWHFSQKEIGKIGLGDVLKNKEQGLTTLRNHIENVKNRKTKGSGKYIRIYIPEEFLKMLKSQI